MSCLCSWGDFFVLLVTSHQVNRMFLWSAVVSPNQGNSPKHKYVWRVSTDNTAPPLQEWLSTAKKIKERKLDKSLRKNCPCGSLHCQTMTVFFQTGKSLSARGFLFLFKIAVHVDTLLSTFTTHTHTHHKSSFRSRFQAKWKQKHRVTASPSL